MKTFTPGGIRCPEAYAQGKMLDHSWWSGKMRGRITPSDIDAFVESYGCVLWWEVTRDAERLDDIAAGQRIAMRNFLGFGGIHAVAILRHGLMSHSKPIDTANDIKEATVYFDGGTRHAVLDTEQWKAFACDWTFNAKDAIDKWLRDSNA